jgi:RHS repeat-associated protein
MNHPNPISSTSKTPYPFGMHMPGRSFSSGSYRYGFNSKGKDDGIKGVGNSLNYCARIYDPRLGRFLSIDPFNYKFPSISGYSFSNNNPIVYIDKNGESPDRKSIYSYNLIPIIRNVKKFNGYGLIGPYFYVSELIAMGTPHKPATLKELENFLEMANALHLRQNLLNAMTNVGAGQPYVALTAMIGKLMNEATSGKVYKAGKKLQDQIDKVDQQRDEFSYKTEWAVWAFGVIDKMFGDEISIDQKIDITNYWTLTKFGDKDDALIIDDFFIGNTYYVFKRMNTQDYIKYIENKINVVIETVETDRKEKSDTGIRVENTSELDGVPNYINTMPNKREYSDPPTK